MRRHLAFYKVANAPLKSHFLSLNPEISRVRLRSSSKFVKHIPQRVVFLTLCSVFKDVVKDNLSCLIIYYEHNDCQDSGHLPLHI